MNAKLGLMTGAMHGAPGLSVEGSTKPSGISRNKLPGFVSKRCDAQFSRSSIWMMVSPQQHTPNDMEAAQT